jgi:hypothetical protein
MPASAISSRPSEDAVAKTPLSAHHAPPPRSRRLETNARTAHDRRDRSVRGFSSQQRISPASFPRGSAISPAAFRPAGGPSDIIEKNKADLAVTIELARAEVLVVHRARQPTHTIAPEGTMG